MEKIAQELQNNLEVLGQWKIQFAVVTPRACFKNKNQRYFSPWAQV